jgi:uncharacterized membrane protein (GlpM family)
MTQYLIKLFISAGVIVLVSELAKKNNFAASIIHSLPLTSLLAFIWLYAQTGDAKLIGNHSFGTFWFVLPTLPMFLVLPWLINKGLGFWPSFLLCIAGTVGLYFLTMKLLAMAGVKL